MPGMKRRDFFKLLAAAPVAAAAAPAIAASVTQGIPAPVMQLQDLSNIYAAQMEYIHQTLPVWFGRYSALDELIHHRPGERMVIVNIQHPEPAPRGRMTYRKLLHTACIEAYARGPVPLRSDVVIVEDDDDE